MCSQCVAAHAPNWDFQAMPLGNYVTDPVRRNVMLLALCQALFMSVQAMSIATTPLAGYMLLGEDKSLATLPIFLTHAGIMLATIPASLLMERLGRRTGFSLGALFGIGSGVVSVLAIYQSNFKLLCVGAILQGFAAGFAWYYRFAAADSAKPAFRAKAISLVMAGGVIAGFVGPQVAKSANLWFAPVTFAGVYVMVSVFSLGALIVVQALRIPTLSPADRANRGRRLSVIARQPGFIVALTSSMFGYGVMTLIMSATPLSMLACGFAFADSATVIQVHIIAMFLPSFLLVR
jgi:MFS family permease